MVFAPTAFCVYAASCGGIRLNFKGFSGNRSPITLADADLCPERVKSSIREAAGCNFWMSHHFDSKRSQC